MRRSLAAILVLGAAAALCSTSSAATMVTIDGHVTETVPQGGPPLSAFAAAQQPPATAASTCIECCEGDPVCEALAGLADLRDTVIELVPQAGIANSLVAKVDAATNSVLDLHVMAALNQLDAFGHEVDALAASDQVAPAVSNVLKAKHDTVKNSISNIR